MQYGKILAMNTDLAFEEILAINDPHKKLLYAIIYRAFLDFANRENPMYIRLPAFNFLVSGGGYWADHVDVDIRELFIRYCKENYYERDSLDSE